MDRCDVYWGSHGCDLKKGHAGVHICGPDPSTFPDREPEDEFCSRFDGTKVQHVNSKREWYPLYH